MLTFTAGVLSWGRGPDRLSAPTHKTFDAAPTHETSTPAPTHETIKTAPKHETIKTAPTRETIKTAPMRYRSRVAPAPVMRHPSSVLRSNFEQHQRPRSRDGFDR
ncbi:MAG: hypothetical protein B7Z80_26265 [Rhodospirillales bacterium 20-64-7]|nr:MAG: hypothetical protein B7Z80_26265 [Rhodospirillales bacterium 20-64-7]